MSYELRISRATSANKIEAQLRQEVQTLLALAEKSDRAAVPDGMDVPAEIARREDRLSAIAQAKAKIEQRAAERFQAEQQEFEAKQAKRKAQREAGKKPRGKDPQPPEAGPKDGDQVNLTDEQSRIMPVSGGGFEQSYNAQAGVDIAVEGRRGGSLRHRRQHECARGPCPVSQRHRLTATEPLNSQ